MINLFKSQRASSVLGLALDGNRLEAVVVRRAVGSLQVKGTVTAPLALSPLGGDPELVGREIRNHLDQAGIREKRCVVSIPAAWVLTVQTTLPDLPEADIESYLQIEAERGFTSGSESLYIVHSRAQAPNGEKFATLLGLPRNHIEHLQKALKAAQLKPVSFALGIDSLSGTGREAAQGALTLIAGASSVELEVSAGGGIVSLRSLDGAGEAAGVQKGIDADLLAREVRITLGQLPSSLSDSLRSVRILARGDLGRQFVGDISPRFQSMGLRVEPLERASAADFSTTIPTDAAHSPALSVAANYVRGVMSGPEFLPPKVSPLQQWMATRFASKQLGWASMGAGAAAAIVIGLFVYQQIQLTTLEQRRKSLEKSAADVKFAKAQMDKFRPWFDDSYTGIRILRRIVEAFPPEGTVTAQRVQIKDLTEVSCDGVATDNRAFLAFRQRLSTTPGLTNVNIVQLTGVQPNLQFNLKMEWVGGDTP
jgi:hypothetical protein